MSKLLEPFFLWLATAGPLAYAAIFGIVFVEAAACGVPQIAGDSGGAAEAVLDGVTGYVVTNPTDVSTLAARIDTVLSDHDLRNSMAKASRLRAEQEFNYDVLASRLGEVLKVAQ